MSITLSRSIYRRALPVLSIVAALCTATALVLPPCAQGAAAAATSPTTSNALTALQQELLDVLKKWGESPQKINREIGRRYVGHDRYSYAISKLDQERLAKEGYPGAVYIDKSSSRLPFVDCLAKEGLLSIHEDFPRGLSFAVLTEMGRKIGTLEPPKNGAEAGSFIMMTICSQDVGDFMASISADGNHAELTFTSVTTQPTAAFKCATPEDLWWEKVGKVTHTATRTSEGWVIDDPLKN